MESKKEQQEKLSFKVHFNNLVTEIATITAAQGKSGGNEVRMSLLILRKLIAQVAERAAELNDPRMNALMCRLALYSISDPEEKEYNPEVLKKVFEDEKKFLNHTL